MLSNIDLSLLDHLGVVLCVVLSLGFGALWYAPVLFGKPWMEAMGISLEDVEASSMALAFGLTAIGTVLSMYGLELAIQLLHLDVWWHGLLLGLAAWLGFILPAGMKLRAWEDRPRVLLAIDAGYEAASAAGAGLLLTVIH